MATTPARADAAELRPLHDLYLSGVSGAVRRLFSAHSTVFVAQDEQRRIFGRHLLAVELSSLRLPPDGLPGAGAGGHAGALARREQAVSRRAPHLPGVGGLDGGALLLLPLSLRRAQLGPGARAPLPGVRRFLAARGAVAPFRFQMRPVPVAIEHRLGCSWLKGSAERRTK